MPSSHSRTYRSDSPARLASSPLVAGPARANCLNRPSRSPGAVSLEREGGYWAVRHAGTVARLPDSLGLRYLNLLIRNPGRELAALDMIRLASAAPASTAPSGAAPPGPVLHPVAATAADDSLDARALAEYRHRLAELDDELAEAERWNDTERASRARAERDFLLRELASATGIHGRLHAAWAQNPNGPGQRHPGDPLGDRPGQDAQPGSRRASRPSRQDRHPLLVLSPEITA